eukprot:5276101-Amphidinium_carterae.2
MVPSVVTSVLPYAVLHIRVRTGWHSSKPHFPGHSFCCHRQALRSPFQRTGSASACLNLRAVCVLYLSVQGCSRSLSLSSSKPTFAV